MRWRVGPGSRCVPARRGGERKTSGPGPSGGDTWTSHTKRGLPGRLQEALRQKEEEFKKASFREAVFAGKSYEGNPDRLRLNLKSTLQEQTVPYLYVEKQEGKITENLRGWAVEKMVNLIHILQPELDKKKRS